MMLLLQKIKGSTTTTTGYFYTPENYNGPGIVEINVNTGEVYVTEFSSFDKEQHSNYFANRAKSVVKQMWDKEKKIDNMPDEKFYAWG